MIEIEIMIRLRDNVSNERTELVKAKTTSTNPADCIVLATCTGKYNTAM